MIMMIDDMGLQSINMEQTWENACMAFISAARHSFTSLQSVRWLLECVIDRPVLRQHWLAAKSLGNDNHLNRRAAPPRGVSDIDMCGTQRRRELLLDRRNDVRHEGVCEFENPLSSGFFFFNISFRLSLKGGRSI